MDSLLEQWDMRPHASQKLLIVQLSNYLNWKVFYLFAWKDPNNFDFELRLMSL